MVENLQNLVFILILSHFRTLGFGLFFKIHFHTQITVLVHICRLIRAQLLSSACISLIASLPLVGTNNAHLKSLKLRLPFKEKVLTTCFSDVKWATTCYSEFLVIFTYPFHICCTESCLRHFHFQCFSRCLRSCKQQQKRVWMFLNAARLSRFKSRHTFTQRNYNGRFLDSWSV